MSEKLKIGMIGAGRMAVFHLQVLKAFEDVELVGLASTKAGTQNREKVCDEFGIANRYDDFLELLDRESLDAVFVCVSVDKMFEVTKECLVEGLPSFIEKPPGLSCEETEELIEIAKEYDAVNMVGLQRRFYSHVQAAAKLIQENGGLTSIVVEAPERFAQIKEKGKFSELALSKWIYANGIHCLDLLPFFGGEIKNVTALSKSWVETVHPDSLHALIEFENGAIGHYISNWGAPGGWSVKLYGNGVRVDLSPLEQGKVFYADGSEEDLSIDKADQDFKPGIYAQDRMFIDACKDRKPVSAPGVDLEKALISMKLAETIVNRQ